MEAAELGCLEGSGSPQKSVKQEVSVRGDRGTTLAKTEHWRLEARPATPHHPHYHHCGFSEQRLFSGEMREVREGR